MWIHSNGLDFGLLPEVTSLLFVYVCDVAVLLVSLVNPCQNWIHWIHESGFGFAHSLSLIQIRIRIWQKNFQI